MPRPNWKVGVGGSDEAQLGRNIGMQGQSREVIRKDDGLVHINTLFALERVPPVLYAKRVPLVLYAKRVPPVLYAK